MVLVQMIDSLIETFATCGNPINLAVATHRQQIQIQLHSSLTFAALAPPRRTGLRAQRNIAKLRDEANLLTERGMNSHEERDRYEGCSSGCRGRVDRLHGLEAAAGRSR
jgi:hypothetical protein